MKRVLILLVMMMALFAGGAYSARADSPSDLSLFSSLPVQHEGRIKPIDSFSRALLILFAGKSSLTDMDSNEWLAEVLFDPASAMERPLFRTYKPDILGLAKNDSHSYSFLELAPALTERKDIIDALLKKEPESWSADQAELMRLHEKSIVYAQLLRSFSPVLPLSAPIPETLRAAWRIDSNAAPALKDIVKHARDLERRVAAIAKDKGEDPANYSNEERAIVFFAYHVDVMRGGGQGNILLRIIPGAPGGSNAEEWLSPWAVLEEGGGTPSTAPYFESWAAMARAYAAGDATAWDEASRTAHAQSAAFFKQPDLSLEVLYNSLRPFDAALALFVLSFALVLASFAQSSRMLMGGALAMASGATILTAAGIVIRVLLLDRPPVGTLYESILFVSLLCAVTGLAIEARRRDGRGVLCASVPPAFLLFIANSFEGHETLGVLTAVLNTNFWLATHVLCITAGYAACIVTSFLAHAGLFRQWRKKDAPTTAPRGVYVMAIASLMLTATGTILGGIWADQSWGRFWGWDPKENGALLIVLWIAWIMHGRMSGHIKETYALAGLALLSIVVAMAWFGVNLLNVGLHSYGFISGVATGLFAFCAAQLALVAVLILRPGFGEKNGAQ